MFRRLLAAFVGTTARQVSLRLTVSCHRHEEVGRTPCLGLLTFFFSGLYHFPDPPVSFVALLSFTLARSQSMTWLSELAVMLLAHFGNHEHGDN